MALKDVNVPSEQVALGEAMIALSPLSLGDISHLLIEHGAIFREALSLFGPVLDNRDYASDLNAYLMAKSPGLLCSAIAASAGEPDNSEVVSKWPIGFQLRAFEVVARLTMAKVNPAAIIREIGLALGPLSNPQFANTQH